MLGAKCFTELPENAGKNIEIRQQNNALINVTVITFRKEKTFLMI